MVNVKSRPYQDIMRSDFGQSLIDNSKLLSLAVLYSKMIISLGERISSKDVDAPRARIEAGSLKTSKLPIFKIDLSDFKSLVLKCMCWISRERNRDLKSFLHPQYLGLTLNSPHQMLAVIHETLGRIFMGSSHFEAAGWSA